MKKPDIARFTGRLNMTYKDLAEKIGKTTGFIGQLASEKSDTSVSYDTLLNLVKEGINADELFGEELGEIFRKRCYEEFLAKNEVTNGIGDKNVAIGIKTIIGGLNLILQEYDNSDIKE